MYLVVSSNCCLQYLLIIWMLKFHGMYDFVLFWRSALLISSIGKNLWHKYKKDIWKICDISITIDFFHSCQENMSLVPRNYLICYFHECVCVCSWGYSCVINQQFMECDCMQWCVYVPVFHPGVMQSAVSMRVKLIDF